jgi:hypothetical protein
MFYNEAQWIATQMQVIGVHDLSPLLNVGSSTQYFRTVVQPYIDALVFKPCRDRGVSLNHLDLVNAAGVDLVGDLTDPDFTAQLGNKAYNFVLCSNLLEHVRNPSDICSTLVKIVSPGSYLLVTVPYAFPYHPDPIDTMFRPDVAQLTALFPGTRSLVGEVIDCGTPWDLLDHNLLVLLGKIVRLFIPFYHHRTWIGTKNVLSWWNRRFSVTCLMLQKL